MKRRLPSRVRGVALVFCLSLLLLPSFLWAVQAHGAGQTEEDDARFTYDLSFEFSPEGGPATGKVRMSWSNAHFKEDKVRWQGKDMDLIKIDGREEGDGELTFTGEVQGNRLTGKLSGKIPVKVYPGKIPGKPQPPPHTELNDLTGFPIEGTFDFPAGKASGFFREESFPWTVTFPPQPVKSVTILPLVVKDGWRKIAADGESKLECTMELPPGFSAEKAEFRLVGQTGASPKNLELTRESPSGRLVRVFFQAPPVIEEPIPLQLKGTVTALGGDGSRRLFEGTASFDLVFPPVVLVHGVWSDWSAWADGLRWLNWWGFKHTSRFNYAETNNGDPEELAQRFGRWLEDANSGPWAKAKADGMLCTKIDLVGHSMGGLIIRRYVSDMAGENKERWKKIRRVVTVGTPHLGSTFARWFAYFSRSRTAEGAPDTLPPPPEVSAHPQWQAGKTGWRPASFVWLVNKVREAKSLEPSFFRDGPAVTALEWGSPFLGRLNKARGHAQKIPYFLFYGDKPLVTEDDGNPRSWTSAAGKVNLLSDAADEVMMETFFAHLCATGTDGVVARDSAAGKGLGLTPRAVRGFHADHIELPGAAIEYVSLALTGFLDRGSGAFTLGRLMSPAHLHAFDDAGRHVGLKDDGTLEIGIPGARYSGREETSGCPETIFVPGEAAVRFEVRGFQTGSFGMKVLRDVGEQAQEVVFRKIGITSGQSYALPLKQGAYVALEHPSGLVPPKSNRIRAVPATDRSWPDLLAEGQRLFGDAPMGSLIFGLILGIIGMSLLKWMFWGRTKAPKAAPAALREGAQLKPEPAREPACESPRESPRENATVSASFCCFCGTPLVSGAKFCSVCGKPVAQPGMVPGPGQGRPPASLAPSPAWPVSPPPPGRTWSPFFLGLLTGLSAPLLPLLFLLHFYLVYLLWTRRARLRAILLGFWTGLGPLTLYVLLTLMRGR